MPHTGKNKPCVRSKQQRKEKKSHGACKTHSIRPPRPQQHSDCGQLEMTWDKTRLHGLAQPRPCALIMIYLAQ